MTIETRRRVLCHVLPLLTRRYSHTTQSTALATPSSSSFSLNSRGFSNVLEFKTLQPLHSLLTPRDFGGKAALIVNTASQCIYASQLQQLETIHKRYNAKGLVVVAVPSNDFGNTEPGTIETILQRYAALNVTFPIAAMAHVRGDTAHPFFRKIADKYSVSVAPTWNFDKFLVDSYGELRAVFPNDTEPLDVQVVTEIEEVLEDVRKDWEACEERSRVRDEEGRGSDDSRVKMDVKMDTLRS
ncbi:hypothetical protein CCR75_002278 [Bremia lactucae]|uniref:Glutathione peroxidase n=1 Tax=Bremia lactucae TaxID=4779 RepID=A0A976FME8_BRELC|nr:hypothetical protein CCR75_002278 [Bremia lactucae]